MAKKNTHVDITRVCKTCAMYDPLSGYCKKRNEPTPGIRYACEDFKTPEEWAKVVEERKREMMRRNEERLNFILTAMMISATSTQMFLEYFDSQFLDQKAESDWRFKRAQAAKEILKATARIRSLYQHNFMEDQTKVMTAHGTKPFNAEEFDNHEADGRYWSLCLCHHLDTCWQDPEAEADVIRQYEARPHMGIFFDKDFRHFTTKQ
jgi:hypothetical protein